MNTAIKNIKVLGSNCPTCKKLHLLTQEAVKQLNLNIAVEYFTDIQRIIELGVMSSPVLIINDQVVLVGQVPSLEKIKEILNSN